METLQGQPWGQKHPRGWAAGLYLDVGDMIAGATGIHRPEPSPKVGVVSHRLFGEEGLCGNIKHEWDSEVERRWHQTLEQRNKYIPGKDRGGQSALDIKL